MSAEPDRSHQKPPFLKRVRIRNYKSIKFCDVELEPLTVLVGRNGSGKSNFVDALGFLKDAFGHSIGTAVREHGGWTSIIHRDGEAKELSFEVELALNKGRPVHAERREPTWFDFELSSLIRFAVREDSHGRMQVVTESASYAVVGTPFEFGFARNEEGRVEFSSTLPDPSSTYPKLEPVRYAPWGPDKLYSGILGSQPFIDVGEGCRTICTYNFAPNVMREHRPLEYGLLAHDGRNLPRSIVQLEEIDPDSLDRVRQYLSVIVPGVTNFAHVSYGDRETVKFTVNHGDRETGFDASSMSDGTLRVFASLMAAFQIGLPTGPSLVAIEEPETSLHPAASAALVDALDEATGRTQILITTHSTELLDNPIIQPKNVRVVEMIDGETVITGVDEATLKIVREGLNTLGGLERSNLLELNHEQHERQKREAATPVKEDAA